MEGGRVYWKHGGDGAGREVQRGEETWRASRRQYKLRASGQQRWLGGLAVPRAYGPFEPIEGRGP